MPEISVIMPVYNVEKYLRECLDSLLAQTFTDFEAICVNDGSTDGSPAILEKYAARDNRIKIIDQPNSGAAKSRNNGMSIACGKYWMFLDSDDRFMPNMLKTLSAYAKKHLADVTCCAFSYFDSTSGKTIRRFNYTPELLAYPMPFSLKDSPFTFSDFFDSPWVFLFSAQHIKKMQLQYQNIPRNNDTFFTLSALSSADRIAVTNDVLLEYRVGLKNNLQSGCAKTPLTFVQALCAIHEFFEQKDLLPFYQNRFAEFVLYCGCGKMKRYDSVEPVACIFEAYKNKMLPRFVNPYSEQIKSQSALKFYEAIEASASVNEFLFYYFTKGGNDSKAAELYIEIEKLQEQKKEILNSGAYRIGKILLTPLNILRKIIK